MSNKTEEEIYNQAYEQGMDHAFKIMEIIATKKHNLSILFLLDVRDALEEIKKIQKQPLDKN